MEAGSLEEAKILIDSIDKHLGPSGEGILEVDNIFLLPVFKILWRMMAGRCTPEDEDILVPLLIKSQEWFQNTTFGPSPVMMAPFLKYLAPTWVGHTAQTRFYEEGRKVASNILKEVSLIESSTPQNFIHAYFQQMSVDKENFFEEDFQVVFMDLVQAGSDTTSCFMELTLLYLILYPDVQEKVAEEIKLRIPSGQDATFSDMAKMPYTQATMLEIHRYGRTAPNFLPRVTTTPVTYKKYTIPPGTVLIPDTRTACNEPIFGEDTWSFRPERFMNKETGEVDPQMRRNMIDFGMGKRVCAGEQLSTTASFLFLASILQKYKLSCVPGEPKPSTEMIVGITTKPKPYRLMVSQRNP